MQITKNVSHHHILNFCPTVFLFGIIIDYGVYMTTVVSDHQYDLGVKCQGQIYLKSFLLFLMQSWLKPFNAGCSYLAQSLPIM